MITIDEKSGTVRVEDQHGVRLVAMGDPEAFRLVSQAWLRVGWDTKYVYSFTWLGRPIIQLPEDMIRLQEVLYSVQPDVIVETGVAHGGGLIFYASLCKAMGKGRVIGVEADLRPQNREAISTHVLSPLIHLIDGSSTDPDVLARVRSLIRPEERVLVTLDSNHSKAHVGAELEAYSALVSIGSYIVAMDGIMAQVAGAPRTNPDWTWNNPAEAAREFVARNPDFVIEEPEFAFNEGSVDSPVTYWPSGYIKRLK